MRNLFIALAASLFVAGAAQAEPMEYKIDKGHTFITFEISHIGFAFLPGTFNDFDGSLTFDEANPENSSTEITVDVASIDTEHAERDKHLRGEDFFNVEKFPTASFKSTGIEMDGNTGKLMGDLTIKGTTKPVTMDIELKNAAKDPWGNYRVAFEATTEIVLADFDIDNYGLGPASSTADVKIAVEATRK
ncbi:MAG: YceI family protein [Gammaproteobacteria bacterium]|nr:YceI family protein [Gammaproteobacteria bacterium]